MANDNSTPPLIAPEDVREIVLGYGLRRAAEACGVTLKQVRRWMSGESRIPLSAYRLLRILGERDLGEVDPTWAGWQLWPDHLHTPEGQAIKGTEFRAAPYEVRAARVREFMATEQAAQAVAERDALRFELQRIKDAKPPRRACSGPAKQRRQGGLQAPVIEQPKPPSRYRSLDPHVREKLLEWYERVLAALDADDTGEPDGAGEIREEILTKRRAVLEDDIEAMGRLGVVGLKRDHIHLVWPRD